MARNRQPEAGSAEPAGVGGVALREGVEDAGLRVARDADACVTDVQEKRLFAARPGGGSDFERDLTRFGELHRVREEVGQNLA